MIELNLNRIRTMKPLKQLLKDVMDFLNFDRAIMVKVYDTEFGWGEEDYEADVEASSELKERIEKRMESLSRHLEGVKAGKHMLPQSDGKEHQESVTLPA